MRILLVEDTLDVGEAIVARFERIGHTVDWEKDGGVADEVLEVQAYDLLILDVNLPALDGFTILKRLRQRKTKTPVLVLTARSQVDDRVDALDLGADDYLVKPFDYRELEARARALLRRSAGESTNQLVCGQVTIDRGSRAVTINDTPIDLTRRELTLLEILAARPGRIFGKDELVDQLFGFDDEPSPNAVEQYVARLRKKLVGFRCGNPDAEGAWLPDRLPMIRPGRSLYSRIILVIAIVFGAGSLALGTAAWFYARLAADDAYDRLLVGAALQIAESIYVQEGTVSVDPPFSAFETLSLSADDRIFYKVVGPRGGVLTGYDDLTPARSFAETRDTSDLRRRVPGLSRQGRHRGPPRLGPRDIRVGSGRGCANP